MENVYTKSEILKKLSLKGYFIDEYTLGTFFEKWKIEAIFENDQGCEYYDKDALDSILDKLFSAKNNNDKIEVTEKEPKTLETNNSEFNIKDEETANILKNISLSSGDSLMNKVQNDLDNNNKPADVSGDLSIEQIMRHDTNIGKDTELKIQEAMEKMNRPGLLQAAMSSSAIPGEKKVEDETDFDDMSLLSESFEAQEKFKEYVLSELSKKNGGIGDYSQAQVPNMSEFKLDISEKTLNVIAKAMAKKIFKHINALFSQETKASPKVTGLEEENKKLTKKLKELDEYNKKLRILLAESNKNLNSFQPTFFGLYKKVSPKDNKGK